jgi:hypothetical protein
MDRRRHRHRPHLQTRPIGITARAADVRRKGEKASSKSNDAQPRRQEDCASLGISARPGWQQERSCAVRLPAAAQPAASYLWDHSTGSTRGTTTRASLQRITSSSPQRGYVYYAPIGTQPPTPNHSEGEFPALPVSRVASLPVSLILKGTDVHLNNPDLQAKLDRWVTETATAA